MRTLWAILTWLPRWAKHEKPWHWRPHVRQLQLPNGFWLPPLLPFFWWQRGESGKDWDFNAFGLVASWGSRHWFLSIDDND